MPIMPSIAPPGVAENALIEARTSQRARAPVGTVPAGEEGGGNPIAEASEPLPIYSIPIETLAYNPVAALGNAQRHGWRVITIDAGGAQLVDLAGDDARPVSVRRGASIRNLVNAGHLAEATLAADTSYEPRVIDFTRLGMSALWMHSADSADQFFTLEPQSRHLSGETLIEEAGTLARQRLENQSERRNSGSMADLGG